MSKNGGGKPREEDDEANRRIGGRGMNNLTVGIIVLINNIVLAVAVSSYASIGEARLFKESPSQPERVARSLGRG